MLFIIRPETFLQLIPGFRLRVLFSSLIQLMATSATLKVNLSCRPFPQPSSNTQTETQGSAGPKYTPALSTSWMWVQGPYPSMMETSHWAAWALEELKWFPPGNILAFGDTVLMFHCAPAPRAGCFPSAYGRVLGLPWASRPTVTPGMSNPGGYSRCQTPWRQGSFLSIWKSKED